MARVIIFSKTFMKGHPRAGEATGFVEKYLNGSKKHIIRAGNHWKPGDMFSPRHWSGTPYRSKQTIIGPDVEVKKVWDIEIHRNVIPHLRPIISIKKHNEPFYLMVSLINPCDTISQIALNDGLSLNDFYDWFSGDLFVGQIICWGESVEY